MDIRAVLFDVNGTLIDIETDEERKETYRAISRFLVYQGFSFEPRDLRRRYFELVDAQLAASPEQYPEFDAVAIWRTILQEGPAESPAILAEKLPQLPLFLAESHRALSRNRLHLYPDVHQVLTELRRHYGLGVVTDAQVAYAEPELREVGLAGFFQTVVISGQVGYRKPDPRLFLAALRVMGLTPGQAVYVGNDMHRDVYGAQQAGLRTIFFRTQYGRKEWKGVRPDHVIERFSELPGLLAALQHK